MVVEKMKRKEHLTPEGLKKIVAIRASMNLGLSHKLQLAFPDVVSVERFLVELSQKIDPQCLAGFTSAEGCFMVRTIASKTHFKGFQVRLQFQVTQHIRDEKLIRWIRDYLNCLTCIDVEWPLTYVFLNSMTSHLRSFHFLKNIRLGESRLYILQIDVKLQIWWNKKNIWLLKD